MRRNARAALALRVRVHRRRHGTWLDLLLAIGAVGLGWLAGRGLAREAPALVAGHAAGLATAALLLVGAGAAAGAHRLLYRARELPLLLAQPLDARDLGLVRLVEVTVGSAIALAVVGGVAAGALEGASLAGTALATLLAAPLVGGAGCVAAWAFARLVGRSPGRGRALRSLGPVLAAGAVVVALVAPDAARSALEALSSRVAGRGSPGAAFVALALAPGPLAAAVLLLEGLAAAGLSLFLVPLGHGEALDAASIRPTSRRGALFGLLGLLVAFLPRPSASLVRRDLTLVLRGAFTRGSLVLVTLPLGLLVFRAAAQDRKLEDWEVRLAALMTEGVLATLAAFLFSIDFPRARAGKLVLERAQPLRGSHVLVARWFEGALPGILLAIGLAVVAATGTPRAQGEALEIGLSGALLAVACAHHGAAFGLLGEGGGGDLGEAAAFPLAGGVVAVLGAVALTISPLGALAYPLLYRGVGKRAARIWEASEVSVRAS